MGRIVSVPRETVPPPGKKSLDRIQLTFHKSRSQSIDSDRNGSMKKHGLWLIALAIAVCSGCAMQEFVWALFGGDYHVGDGTTKYQRSLDFDNDFESKQSR